jgi:hypothetical protein
MVKLVNNVVTESIVTNGVTPYNNDGWVDVSNNFYQGQPVSIGWTWDGLQYLPPPAPVQLPA